MSAFRERISSTLVKICEFGEISLPSINQLVVNISIIYVLKYKRTKGRGNLIVALYFPDQVMIKAMAVFIEKKRSKND